MKRLLTMILLLTWCLCACGRVTDGGQTASDNGSVASDNAVTTSDSAAAPEITMKQLRRLMDENLYCMQRVLTLGFLPYGGDPVAEDHIYRVQSDRFTTYAQLREYLLTVYTEEETENLLNHGGYPTYLDVDGYLCIDVHHTGGKGYYVDWTNYELTLDSMESAACHFTVTGVIEEPAEVPVKEPYSATATAVYENGRWVLTAMIW